MPARAKTSQYGALSGNLDDISTVYEILLEGDGVVSAIDVEQKVCKL
jgi:hypothetical protein